MRETQQSIKKSENNMRELIEKEGYKLISSELKRNSNGRSTRMFQVACPSNHIYNVSRSTWKSGKRCLECYRNIPLSRLEKIASENNCKILSYDSTQGNITFICSCGEQSTKSYYSFTKRGYKLCTFCIAGQSQRVAIYNRIGRYAE